MAGPRIVVIGAGPGGICAGILLRKAGLGDFTILERAAGVGGTWWHNRYPGAACDVPSDLYSFSFELKADWSKPYAYQPEIRAYLEHCVDAYGVAPHLRLSTGARALHWDDECLLWRIVTDAGDVLDADVVISALGMFNEPKWPAIAGLETFAGTRFHSARWPDDVDLAGRDVAVIGSAASAVQLVPEVAKVAASLTVYQRTANWVLPKDDDPFDAEALEAFRRDPMAVRQRRWRTWNALERFVLFSDERLLAELESAGLANLAAVADPEVRERLRPKEPFGCKRPLFSNDWYPTFNRPEVSLVTVIAER
jgi:cyclohexanone monooxygenase